MPQLGEVSGPSLLWSPRQGGIAEPLEQKGAVARSPFDSRDRAMAEVKKLRAAGHDDSTFLVTREPSGKYAVYEFAESHILDSVQLGELKAQGLPLGGSTMAPETYLVDSEGYVGRLSPTARTAEACRDEADDSFVIEKLS